MVERVAHSVPAMHGRLLGLVAGGGPGAEQFQRPMSFPEYTGPQFDPAIVVPELVAMG